MLSTSVNMRSPLGMSAGKQSKSNDRFSILNTGRDRVRVVGLRDRGIQMHHLGAVRSLLTRRGLARAVDDACGLLRYHKRSRPPTSRIAHMKRSLASISQSNTGGQVCLSGTH